MGARISGWDPRGVHEVGAHPGGGRALHPHGHMVGPPGVFSVPKILEKIILNFQGICRTFIFGVFFIARIIQKTDKRYFFALFNLNNRK